MKVMTMKMPAIRATLLDGGSPGRSSGARSVCSGGAESVITGSFVSEARTAEGRRAKGRPGVEPQGLPRHVEARLESTVHHQSRAHTQGAKRARSGRTIRCSAGNRATARYQRSHAVGHTAHSRTAGIDDRSRNSAHATPATPIRVPSGSVK